MRHTLLRALWVTLAVTCGAAPAAAEKHAFVVGIDTYDNIRSLKKARGDARAMEAVLKELGFTVIKVEDATRSSFNKAWQDYLDTLKQDDVAAIFFAGHGVELGGRVYLVPRDVPYVKASRQDQLMRESISFPELLSDLHERKTKFNLVILDACRENPFDDDGRSVGRVGLPNLAAVEGTFIMYSAGVREFALDRLGANDGNANSIYTRLLLPMLRTPDLPLTALARKLRQDVSHLAASIDHVQRPAYYDGITSDVCLLGAACGSTALEQMYEAYEKARVSRDAGKLRAFIEANRQISPTYAALAQEDLDVLEGRQRRPMSLMPPLTQDTKTGNSPPPRTPTKSAKENYWEPGQELKVCFMDGSRVSRQRVADFASEWTKYANLKFDFGDVQSCKSDGTEHIRVSFVGAGYWSYEGKESLTVDQKRQTLNLQGYNVDAPPSSLEEMRGHVLHEFGHAIGLQHQHQNPRGKCDEELDRAGVLKSAASFGWPLEKVREESEPIDGFDPNIDYDIKSIMTYSLPKEWFKLGDKSRCWIEGNKLLSDGDKRAVAYIYPATKVIELRKKLLSEFTDVLSRSGFTQPEVDSLRSEFAERLATMPPSAAR